jgi:CspA family cold shock protein
VQGTPGTEGGREVSEGSSGEVFRGTVKWFNEQRGYGFIARENSPDVFVHHTAIKMDGFRVLREGEEVNFEITQGPKGLQAVNVSRAT